MTIEWEWPQYLWLGLAAMNLLAVAHLHGQQKSERYCFITTALNTVFIGWVLACGGFF